MNKKISLGVAVAFMALTAAATFIITFNFSLNTFNAKLKSVHEKEEAYSRLAEIDNYVRNNYISQINEEALTNSTIRGYIAGLGDPYAQYYSPDEYARLQQRDAGILVGLGFEFDREESGYIRVISVMENTSAHEEGLAPGDVITAVNNTDVIAYENGYEEAVTFLRCDEGVKVKLHVKRSDEDGGTEFFTVDLTSRTIDIITVFSEIIDDNGYIVITSFNEKTPLQLEEAIFMLTERGAKSLIFDLRDNAGGLTEALRGSLEGIVGAGDIVTAYYRDTEKVIVATENPVKLRTPMVVIVNGNTSSSAELFAFALRDINGAQVVGVNSYGKGVMQAVHKLSTGGAVRITVATLQTEKSGDYNGIGIKPHFDVSLPSDVDLNNISREARLLFDTQLIKALEVADTIR
ncbi:MAG: S41 family peptidase [Oscillospiraceae bacterium]|nr:S41 family peptidase [Oscillospiraceae bacterium]